MRAFGRPEPARAQEHHACRRLRALHSDGDRDRPLAIAPQIERQVGVAAQGGQVGLAPAVGGSAPSGVTVKPATGGIAAATARVRGRYVSRPPNRAVIGCAP